MKIRFFIIIHCIIFFSIHANAQELKWISVESAIAKRSNLTQLNDQLEQGKRKALQEKNYVEAARFYVNQMQIADLKSEDTLFFKNSLFIDSFLNNKDLPLELESVMLILKAKRLAKFNLAFGIRKNKILFFIPPGTINYTQLNTSALDSLVQLYFNQAKEISIKLPVQDIKKFLWLSTDPLLFLFKPNYTDLIFGEQLQYASSVAENNYNSNNQWLSLTPDSFITQKKFPTGINDKQETIFKLYQQWAAFHLDQKEIFYFIESLARKYFYNRTSTVENNYARPYEIYLQELTKSPYTIVKANGVYQLCLYWYNLAKNYNRPIGLYYYDKQAQEFDSTFRRYYVKSLNLLKENTNLLDSFFYLKKDLLVMKKEIKSKIIDIKNQEVYLPGEKVSAQLVFKNVENLYIKIVKLNSIDLFKNIPGITKEKLVNASAFNDTIIKLPASGDYQIHAAEIEMARLPLGYYAILYSDSASTGENKNTNFFTIQVSNISAINNDNQLYVLNRKNGQPLIGAKVLVQYRPSIKDSIKNAAAKLVNREGYVIVANQNVENIFVISANDTTKVDFHSKNESVSGDVYDKDEYDNVLEYYEENLNLHLFTDRAIYRPGQTVFFKGILFTKDPGTGEMIVLNKHNLKFPLLKKLFDKKVKDLWKGKFVVYVEDAFGRNVDSISTSINEYGSFAGSYKTREDAATGDWGFDTELIDISYQNEGSFQVEEYKRPSFELTIEKPKEYLQFGDSFNVKVKVRSFADVQLTNVKVIYSIDASYSYPALDSLTGKESEKSAFDNIAYSTGYTDSNGELSIKIPSRFLSKFQFDNKTSRRIRYEIDAEAVDATGESHEESMSLNLLNRPVEINVTMPAMYERKQIGFVAVTSKNEFSGSVIKKLKVVIYKLENAVKPKRKYLYNTDYEFQGDSWIYKVQNGNNESVENKKLIYETEFTSNKEKLKLPQELLDAGDYKLEITCIENGNIIGWNSKTFSVFDKEENKWPAEKENFHYLPVTGAARGEKINWYFGTPQNVYSIYHAQYFATTSKGVKAKYQYFVNNDVKGLHEWQYTIPMDAVDKIILTHLYVFNNELYRETATIYVAKQQLDRPELIIEQYRKRLTPGSKQTFVITIKTKNENTAAELMTTMYDASLDKIEKHQWKVPNNLPNYNMYNSWSYNIGGFGTSSLYNNYNVFPRIISEKETPLWWLNSSDSSYFSSTTWNGIFNNKYGEMKFNMLAGKVSGVSISQGGLEAVVVTGVGISKSLQTGSATRIVIRGSTSLSSYNIPLVIMDGQVYEGDMSKINTNLISDAVVLKGADATALYGSKAANGVIIISTNGPLIMPKAEEPPLIIRKNFSETAFFFPQIHADKEGFYNISFMVPESVTEWNWKMLSHTKGAKFMYQERNIVTQLPLMVQPNMPRFLYQGDVINLQTRISNLDSNNLSGTSACIIEDAVTGEDITSKILAIAKSSFSVEKKSNTNNSFLLKIPEDLLHPLKIKVTARAGSFSDGEEYTIPILSKKILVSKNVNFHFVGRDTLLPSPIIPADSKTYGVGIYITPKPQSALLNALPFLAFDPFNCAEQIFNKMLAYSLSLKIMRTDSVARNTMAGNHAFSEETKNPSALPDELSEQTMPWLHLNHQTDIYQQQLRKIFDTLKSKNFIEKYVADISTMQNQDGGIPWFKGGESNYYISGYLLEGFGKLKNDSVNFLINNNVIRSFHKMIPSLINFCDTSFLSGQPGKDHRQSDLFFLLSRSYWVKEFPLSMNAAKKVDSLLKSTWNKVQTYNLKDQAVFILASLHFSNKEDSIHQKAINQLESIRQLAIVDEANGIRWKDISNSDDLDVSDEETIAMLASAYEQTGHSKDMVDGIIQWLLTSKQQHNWSTTKSTAAVIELLSKHQSSITGSPIVIDALMNDSLISVTDNLLKGQSTGFVQLKQFPKTIQLKKFNNSPVSGGFNYYYFSATPPIENVADVKISKQLFRLNSNNNKWDPIDSSTTLNIADKIKSTITINTNRELKYVLIDEKCAASFEPSDPLSGYQYGKDFGFYRSVRDVGYQFFAEKIPSGITSISYETIVSKEGEFYSGTVSLQCMYRPEVKAYGRGGIISVKVK